MITSRNLLLVASASVILSISAAQATNGDYFATTGIENADGFSSISIQGDVISSQVPEPASLALFGLGLAGLGLARRRKN